MSIFGGTFRFRCVCGYSVGDVARSLKFEIGSIFVMGVVNSGVYFSRILGLSDESCSTFSAPTNSAYLRAIFPSGGELDTR